MLRNRCADRDDLNRCILRSRRRTQPPGGKMRLPSHETGFDLANSPNPARYRDNAFAPEGPFHSRCAAGRPPAVVNYRIE